MELNLCARVCFRILTRSGTSLLAPLIDAFSPQFSPPPGHGVEGIVLPEKEEKVLAIRKGDAIALPFGVVTWWYNKEDTELVVLFLGDTSKGHKAGSFTDFFLTGSNGIFNGFSTEFVSRAWDLEENVTWLEGKQAMQKPSFELSGKLAAETNSIRGAKWLLVVLADASENGDDDDNSVTET